MQTETCNFELVIKKLGSMIRVRRILFGNFASRKLNSLPGWDISKMIPFTFKGSIKIPIQSSVYPNFIIEGDDGKMIDSTQLIFKRPIIRTTYQPIFDARLARSNWIDDAWKINPIKNFLSIYGFDTTTLGVEVQARNPVGSDLLESEKEWASTGDCFIAILTSRFTLEDHSKIHSAWVHTESGLSYSRNRPQLVFVEDGVKIEGLYNYTDSSHIIKFRPGNENDLVASKNRIQSFREECNANRLRSTVTNIGSILLVGSAIFGAATFLSTLGK